MCNARSIGIYHNVTNNRFLYSESLNQTVAAYVNV
jgi:hypothetical protein